MHAGDSLKPYYDDGRGIVIYNASCDDVLPSLADASIRLVFTSPPYNLGLSPGGNGAGFYTHNRGGRSATKWANFVGYGEHDDAMPIAEYEAWQRSVLSQCWRIIDNDGAIFYNHKPRVMFGELWTPLSLNPGFPLRQIITWHCGNGISLGDRHFAACYEWILLLAKPGFRLVDRRASAMGDHWTVWQEHQKWGHPAPFPIELPKRAIAASGATSVLDPFAGSGTTLAAAKALGRRAIGIELNERYCEIAARRLSQEVLPLEAMP